MSFKGQLFISFFFVIVGCATVSEKKELPINYITSDNLSSPTGKKYTSEVLIKEMTRKDRDLSVLGAYTSWEVEAYPYTKPLIIAEKSETGLKNMEPQEKIELQIKTAITDLFAKDTCFNITIRTKGTIESAQFKYWLGKFSSHDNKTYDLTFISKNDVPNNIYLGSGVTEWVSYGVGCVGKPMDLTKNFKVYLIPQIIKSVQSIGGSTKEKAELNWIIK